MDSLTAPIECVVEAAQWFVATPSLRVLHVTTTQLLRLPVLQHLVASELLDGNDAPFLVLEAPTEPDDDGWALRCEELRADWEALVASAPAGVSVAPLWPECAAATALARFAQELSEAQRALRPPMGHLVVVLAPVWVRDAARWCADLGALLAEQTLRAVRFAVVESEEASARPALATLGAQVEWVDARIDDAGLRTEMNARLEAMRRAPAGATGAQLVGAAGPAVAPPARIRHARPLPPAEREARAREIGVPTMLLDPASMHELRVLVMSATLAMRDGRVAEGTAAQREARDFCARNGLTKEAVVNELVLAGYVMQGGAHERALEVFREAQERAERGGLGDLAVQARLAIGSCLLVLRRVDEAAVAYAEAGRRGVAVGATVLAIEAFRMCGQLRASQGHLEQAATAFREALAVADVAGDAVRSASSAPLAARALAALCRTHGLMVQADALEAQADAMESPRATPESAP
jgi:tetratricopeptide (TPR) repeat protein